MEMECDLGHVGNRHQGRSKLRWGMDRETMERGEVRRLSIKGSYPGMFACTEYFLQCTPEHRVQRTLHSARSLHYELCTRCDIEKIMKIRKSEIKFRGSIRSGPMRKQEWGNGN